MSDRHLLEIQNPYDSHVHFLATGETASLPELKLLKHPTEIVDLKWDSSLERAGWKYAFGWDENLWSGALPSREILDHYFKDQPVFLSRCDGHSSWVNTAALKKLGLMSASHECDPMIPRNADGYPIGILRETAHIRALHQLPTWTKQQQKNFLKKSMKVFLQGGITHIREMTATEELYDLLRELEDQNELEVSIDLNFVCDQASDNDRVIGIAQKCSSTKLIKIRGIKIFYDGSLGSETALLSQPYPHHGHRGLVLWEKNDLSETIKKVFAEKLEICFHTIGDQAAHDLVSLARTLSQEGHLGRFNFEHVSILKPQTIQMMKPLHLRCHMQPVYWLSDQSWLKEKIGDLFSYAFPWEALRRAQISLQFGSDSPIEPPGIWGNIVALRDSANGGIPKLGGDISQFHSSPYQDVVSSKVKMDRESGEILSLHFDGKVLI